MKWRNYPRKKEKLRMLLKNMMSYEVEADKMNLGILVYNLIIYLQFKTILGFEFKLIK